jgi:signal transduction histidine kinase
MIGTSLPAGTSFAEAVIDSGQLMEIDHRTDRSRVEVPDSLPAGPTLGVPVIAGGAAKASLTFVRALEGEAFSRADRLFAEALAAQAALALELERARRDREQMILVGDRERIGRDLHDHVVQRLFAAGLGLQSSLALIERPQTRERVQDAVDLLDETIREIRNTIFSVSRARASDDLLLRSEVTEVLRQARSALGFEPSISFEGPVDAGVPDDVVPHVLAVVREALSNVTRHARAGAVEVRIVLLSDVLLVAVTDNGIGITDPQRSSGLGNLHERARILGGSLKISSPTGGGTCLEWMIPVR